jgi:glycosyltransferase involved in cell wall biosynthesis
MGVGQRFFISSQYLTLPTHAAPTAACTLACENAKDNLGDDSGTTCASPRSNEFPAGRETALILLDVSRLLVRSGRATPTGIDRVELAYAEWLASLGAGSAQFVARGPLGEITLLPHALALRLIELLGHRWRGGGEGAPADLRGVWLRIWLHLILHREWELHVWLRLQRLRPTLLVVSHRDLDRSRAIMRLKGISGARFVCFVHDLIPLEAPHFAGERQPEIHARRMTTVARLADEVIVNSAPTAEVLGAFCRTLGRVPPITVAPLGVAEAEARQAPTPDSGSYFVVVATIEPKKNHLLLLDVWERLSALSTSPPRLLLIGQRGWKTGPFDEALRRASIPAGLVEERGALTDAAVQSLVRGARALLAPAFTEGFGLPVAEALALGTPVICSDIPAHRFAGREAPDYLSPHEPEAWLSAVMDYASETGLRREAQRARISRWKAPRWSDHFEKVSQVLARH